MVSLRRGIRGRHLVRNALAVLVALGTGAVVAGCSGGHGSGAHEGPSGGHSTPYAYVTTALGDSVIPINLSSMRAEEPIRLAAPAVIIALSSDGRMAYVTTGAGT